jgi:hypothetical protein
VYGIAAKRRMESAQRAAWNHANGVYVIANGDDRRNYE